MLTIEIEREDDGRWLAEVPALPGVMAYGATRAEARQAVEALALRVLASPPAILPTAWKPSPPTRLGTRREP